MTEVTPTLEARLESLGHELVVAVINLELHSPYATEVQENLQQIVGDVRHILDTGVETVRVSFDRDEVRVMSRPQLGASLQARKLLNIAAERSVATIEFLPNLETAELLRFLVLFSSPGEVGAFRPGTIEPALQKCGVHRIRVEFGSPRRDSGSVDDPNALRGYQDLADCLQESHVAASRGDTLSLDRAAGVVEQALAEMDREPSGLLALAHYDDIDSFTVGHSVRVALLTMQVARAAGADDQTLLKAGTAGLLHDIGKSRIPQAVLFKQGPLDDDEWKLMGMHPRLGAEILIEQPDIDPTAIGAAFCHHMAPGERGYPTPALPFEPSGISRLVRVCDVFEALTSVRPYKPALTPVEAYAIMHRNPGDFDQEWLRFFVDSIGLYPLGTKLVLDSGEYATVIGHGSRRDQPRIRILEDADGNALPADAPAVVAIGDEVDGVTRSICHVAQRQRHDEPEVDPDQSGVLRKPCC